MSVVQRCLCGLAGLRVLPRVPQGQGQVVTRRQVMRVRHVNGFLQHLNGFLRSLFVALDRFGVNPRLTLFPKNGAILPHIWLISAVLPL